VLQRLGDSHQAGGDHDRAADAWRRARLLLIELGHADADRVQQKLNQLSGAEPRDLESSHAARTPM
jgi:predicted component of type VI protein secretion system